MRPLLRHAFGHVERKPRIMRTLERVRRQLLTGKTAHLLGELLLLVAEIEVHRLVSSPPTMRRAKE